MDQAPRRRRGAAGAIAAVAGSVVLVTVVLTVPHAWMVRAQVGGPTHPRTSPAPVPVLDDPGDRSWRALVCRDGSRECAVPTVLDHGGLRLRQYAVDRSAIQIVDDRTRQLSTEVPAVEGNRWVLVGAEHSDRSAYLDVTIGTSIEATIPAGRLTLFPVSGRVPKTVTLAERGQPADGEVLYVSAYRFTS